MVTLQVKTLVSQAKWPKVNPQDSHVGRRELTHRLFSDFLICAATCAWPSLQINKWGSLHFKMLYNIYVYLKYFMVHHENTIFYHLWQLRRKFQTKPTDIHKEMFTKWQWLSLYVRARWWRGFTAYTSTGWTHADANQLTPGLCWTLLLPSVPKPVAPPSGYFICV